VGKTPIYGRDDEGRKASKDVTDTTFFFKKERASTARERGAFKS